MNIAYFWGIIPARVFIKNIMPLNSVLFCEGAKCHNGLQDDDVVAVFPESAKLRCHTLNRFGNVAFIKDGYALMSAKYHFFCQAGDDQF